MKFFLAAFTLVFPIYIEKLFKRSVKFKQMYFIIVFMMLFVVLPIIFTVYARSFGALS